jgi:hypothetical protein
MRQYCRNRSTPLQSRMDIRNISTNNLILWVVAVLGLGASLMIGSAVGSSDIRMVAGALAAIPALVIFAKLKTNIWVLIPIGWYLTGRLPWLPLPFSIRDLTMMAAIGSFLLFAVMRAIPMKRKLCTLDYLIYINLAYLATVYARNPAGFWAMQTSMVGGRPYLEIILAFGAYLVLSRVQISDFLAKIFPLFFVIPAWGVGLLDMIGQILPRIGLALNAIYTGIGPSSIVSGAVAGAQVGTTRLSGLQNAGLSAVLALCAKFNPITLISPLYPVRVGVFTLALLAIFLSGFRSVFLFALVAFILSSVLRKEIKNLWAAGGALILLVTILISIQGSLLQLPLTMQRTLSWLPGNWDEAALADAEGSSRWRFEMWEWAWNDDRILRDRVWGQGFGLTIEDMNLISASLLAGQGGASMLGGSDRENFMITGSFHSGPLSTIKYIGVVGLTLYYFLMCYMAVLAWRLCGRAQGTNAFTLALFVGIPLIYEPFNFVIVFGALDSNYPQLLFWAGLLNMTQRYLESLKPAANPYKEAMPVAHPGQELEPVLNRQAIVRRPL